MVDLTSGTVLHRLRVGPQVDEVHDAAFLPGITSPRLLGPEDDDTRYLLRPLTREMQPYNDAVDRSMMADSERGS